ncbi:MAG: MBL fold metallo-hydrolase [Proteobacteria bacterium]|nr:MBL fold metallo-hydrolase [Pseudomonadota bacterium]
MAMLFRQLFDSESSTYTYLLAAQKGGEALLIDPVRGEVPKYLQLIEELDLQLIHAIDTHVHADHVTGLGDLRDQTGCVTIMGEQSRAECVSRKVTDGEVIKVDGIELRAMHTPGHTDDSFSFVMDDRVFTGDTLLIRGTGRTDFQNGDARAQYDSLFNKLLELPEETLVFPAHDYKGWMVSTIGEELGVNTIMEGRIQRMDDRLRVNVQLIDVSTDEHLWAETFDRELSASNMFAIQSEIASAVAKAFEIELSVDEQQRISSRPTENTAAYEAYLMGKHLLAKRTIPAMAESAEFFQQAITLDPDYALAYVGLADAFYVLEWWGDRPSEELLVKSRDALDRALELDDSLGEAYASLGAHLEFTDLGQSENAYQRSIELSPNYATAYHWYGTTLRQLTDRLEEAGILFERARELDPLSAIINAEIGSYLEELGHFDEARAQLNKVLTIDPGLGEIYSDLAALVNTAYRRIDEALAHLHKEISTLGTSVLAEPLSVAWVYVNIAQLYLQIGADDKAVFWIDKALDLAPDHIGARIAMLKLRLLQGEEFEWTNYPREPPQTHRGLGPYDLLQLRDVERLVLYHDLRAGQYAQARERYAQYYPELLQASPPEVKRQNYAAAINLALVLAGTGEEDRAKQLLADSLRVIESMPRLGRYGFQIADVLIYAIQGEREKTLAALREAIDDGWQYNARYILEFEPSLFSLQPDPEYQGMVAEVKAELAEQLRRVQEMERRGELALPPWMLTEP